MVIYVLVVLVGRWLSLYMSLEMFHSTIPFIFVHWNGARQISSCFTTNPLMGNFICHLSWWISPIDGSKRRIKKNMSPTTKGSSKIHFVASIDLLELTPKLPQYDHLNPTLKYPLIISIWLHGASGSHHQETSESHGPLPRHFAHPLAAVHDFDSVAKH